MAKKELKCQRCANQVNGDYCTMFKEMHEDFRDYKKCEGFKQYVAPLPKVEVPKIVRPTNYEELGDFGIFLQKGGAYSLRTDTLLFRT